jgi:hypothetical protein
MQLKAYKNLYIFPFDERKRKHDESAAWAVPLLQTLFTTSRIGGPNLIFTFNRFFEVILSNFGGMLNSRHGAPLR